MHKLFSAIFVLVTMFVMGCSDNSSVAGPQDVGEDVSVDVSSQDSSTDVYVDAASAEDVIVCNDHPDCVPEPCQTSYCDTVHHKCVFKYADPLSPCEDGNVCTQNDKCNADHVCQPGAKQLCDDGKKCTIDTCDSISGCLFLNLPANSQCEDGSTCTINDKCDNGTCKGQVVNCDDGNVCTNDKCVENNGCLNEKVTNIECDDGNVCTKNDACLIGVCKGEVNPCDDGNPCTYNKCDSKLGCSYTPVNDGNLCEDGDKCTKNDTCQSSVCKSGTPAKCDDQNSCTKDSCESATGDCVHDPINAAIACNDNNACSQEDTCDSKGNCIGKPKMCYDGLPCTEDLCNAAYGCEFPKVKDGNPCDDGKPCTYGDSCKGSQCIGNVNACEDGNSCTLDQCNGATGDCLHSTLNGYPCDDGNYCTLSESCSETQCIPTSFTKCDDGNPCTSDTCYATSGCFYNPTPGMACNDGDACTLNELCNGTKCVGSIVNCDDKDKCTTDTCDSKTGTCSHVPIIGCVP